MGSVISVNNDSKYSDKVKGYIYKWVFNKSLEKLVEAFGGNLSPGMSMNDRLKQLISFSKRWDFRRQNEACDNHTGEQARWLIRAEINREQEQVIMTAAEELGLIGKQFPMEKQFDHVLVLGGARMSCLYRVRYAGDLCEKHGITTNEIVCLTGMRPVMESERTSTDTYAPEAGTEFDLMRMAVKQIFKSPTVLNKQEDIQENKNGLWAVVRYEYNPPISILAAPSSEPDIRRANTADTFTFYEQMQDVGKNKKLLLITSQIYVPYQQMEAVRILGIPQGHYVEAVGFPQEWSAGLAGLQTPANYLQEIRSALLAMEKTMQEIRKNKGEHI